MRWLRRSGFSGNNRRTKIIIIFLVIAAVIIGGAIQINNSIRWYKEKTTLLVIPREIVLERGTSSEVKVLKATPNTAFDVSMNATYLSSDPKISFVIVEPREGDNKVLAAKVYGVNPGRAVITIIPLGGETPNAKLTVLVK